MAKRRDQFEIRFPGVIAEPKQKTHLLKLARSYADYDNDVKILGWLLRVADDRIPQEDKVILKAALLQASTNCDIIKEQIGKELFDKLVVATRKVMTVSSDLHVALVFNKHAKAYWKEELEHWKDLYKQAAPFIPALATKKRSLKTKEDKLTEASVDEIRANIQMFSKNLGLNPLNVFREVHYNIADALVPTFEEHLATVNAEKAYAIYKNLEKQEREFTRLVSEYGTLHLDTRDAKAKLERLNRDFRSVMGYSLKELIDKGFDWSMMNWKSKKR